MQAPDSLGREIRAADPAFLWLVILNDKGETLARVSSEKYTARMRIRKQTQERLGTIDTVFLGATAQAERWYGRRDFILLAYRRAKVMLMFSEKHGVYLAAKIPRSAMTEHPYPKVRHILVGSTKAAR